ncbi:MAG: hypothetical protein WCW01_06970 [Gammaproteobacteria bacterium]|jgi:hypothetical protein
MFYDNFRTTLEKYPFFRSNIFPHIASNVDSLRLQVTKWIAKGYVIPLKRGFYTLREKDRAQNFSVYFLANNLYSPSYVSLETALSYYGFIPEKVVAITSVTSKKTQHFDNDYGNFVYHNIKESLYDDYIALTDEFSNTFLMATKERAMIDFLYLKVSALKDIDTDIFQSSYRMQNLDSLDHEKLKIIAAKFKNKKLDYLVDLLLKTTGE